MGRTKTAKWPHHLQHQRMSVEQHIASIRKEINGSVTLVAVSKTKPVEAILEAYTAGQREFGENKVQELVGKFELLPKDIHWHLIGHLQSNKVKYIAPFVSLIHSVDGLKLLAEINKQALKNKRIIDCLLQFHVATEETKFGLNQIEAIELLNSDTYSIDLAEYDNGNITPNGESISLTKTALAENPILLNTVINQGNHKIGYLMYNGFYASYDYQLNAAFGQMQSANITDLVLDLRYNSGGSIRTATRLASMITGQFNGQLFAKEQWNAKAQAYYEDTNPGNLKNNFSNSIGTTSINSLNLNKIYILTSKSTASASELIINCLKPYIDVIQIGDTTTGKNVGSITLYDSPTFTKSDASGSHYYAMQPIVLKIVNKNGFGDYTSGLAPNYPLVENLGNLNTLGNISEPLLSTAIGLITANGRMLLQNPLLLERDFEDVKSMSPLRSEMYKEQN